ncbi:MAG: FAD-dependent oxidoreductase, partial [Rhodospirillales bacterium]|nr:FAD-dependent oxidoreductase [Acetobacter sp.]
MNSSATLPSIAPSDKANRRTIASGHPPDWQPPQPKPLYDLVVLGGGPAGTMAVLTATKAGHTVAVVERNLTGGTCVNFGCTPSKALIRAARAVFQARDGEKFGYRLAGEPQIDFAAVITRVHEMRAEASAGDSVALMATAGADFYLGEARFVGPDTVEVDGQRLKFKKAVLATGSGPAVPDLPGLAEASYLTNETLFELTELPRRLVCLGGGTINCELAQAFCRLGSQVELVGSADRLLPGEVPEASELIAKQLRREGVKLHLGVKATRVDGRRKCLTLSDGRELEYDALL